MYFLLHLLKYGYKYLVFIIGMRPINIFMLKEEIYFLIGLPAILFVEEIRFPCIG